jgi:hypothetical protein
MSWNTLLESLTYFSRDLENLSPARREALNSPPSLVGKGAGGLGLALIFPHDVKSQESISVNASLPHIKEKAPYQGG